MHRREVIQAAGLGLAALAIPGWVSCQRTVSSRVPRGMLHDAWTAARAKGRPLFVLHGERDSGADEQLGMLFGTFLLQAPTEQIAPLATCEIACATTEEFRQLAPHFAPRVVRALILWPDGKVTSAVSGEPPATSMEWALQGPLSEHFDWLAEQLESAFHADPSLVERMAAIERAAIGSSPTGALPDVDFASTWPCEALLRSRREPEHRGEWEAALAAAARERWSTNAPVGSAWRPYDPCPPCGMGYVDSSSHRFLEFYTAGDSQ